MVVTIHVDTRWGAQIRSIYKEQHWCFCARVIHGCERCPIMISNRSKGLLRQIGARVGLVLIHTSHPLPSKLPTQSSPPPPPPEWSVPGSFPLQKKAGVFFPYPWPKEYSADQKCQHSEPSPQKIFMGGGGGVDIKWNSPNTKEVKSFPCTLTDSSCAAAANFPVQIFLSSSWTTWHGSTFTTKNSKVL